jgi:hypothetical protein
MNWLDHIDVDAYVSMWIKLKLDWSQHSYQEDIQARIMILKKLFSMDA